MNEPTEFLRSGRLWRDCTTRFLLVVALLVSPIAWSADSDGDGIPDDVEVIEGRNPSVKDNDVFASNRLFAMQQYRDFLGREGDAGGIQFYVDHLAAGTLVRANVVENFFNSPEFQGVGSPVARLYFAFFLRIPDYPGLIFQINAYRTGTPLAVIANNFSLSPEFQATYGALTNAAYVALLYQNVLGRTPAQSEIDFHVNRLSIGVTRGEVMLGFSESPEYQNNTAHSVYVTMMYVGMLRRAPEQAGFDYWVAYMNAGNSGLALILGFLNAPEFHDRFLPAPTAVLTVGRTGNGSGTVTSLPAGINCGVDCNENYNTGTAVTLTATPAVGSTFGGWGGACAGIGTCMITMDAAKSVSATFTLNTFVLTVSKSGNGSGTVSSSPPGISCGATCAVTYDYNTMVTLSAAASVGSTFSGWGGACAGTGTCMITMDGAKSVSANFTLNTYALTVSLAGNGFGTVSSSPPGVDCGADCTENYNPGTVVTLTAAASNLSIFSGWSGACAGTGTCIVTMDAARSVSAFFALNCGATCFVEPYAANGSLPPSPTASKLALSTQLQKADVGFIVDTTGSMAGEISALKTTLSTTIIPALKTKIPNLGVGVAAHDDFPFSGFGMAGCDFPFYFPLTPQGYVTTITADSQTAANALTTHCGGDGPESQVPAIYHAVTGSGLTWPGGSVAAVTPPAGTFGAMRFRSDAFPIVINITDIGYHNGKRALDKTGTTYDAAFQNAYSFATYNVDDVVTKLNSLGAKFIGVSADGGARTMGVFDPYGYHAYITDKTNSNALPSALTHGATCIAAQCCTGVSGAGVAPDGPGGTCRSVFSINTSGTGLSTSIVDGVAAVLNSVQFDVYVQAYNDAAETTDVVGNFMQSVVPDPTGGTDPFTGAVCVAFPAAQLADLFTGPKALVAAPDGVNDTIKQVNPGPLYCFNVIPKANNTVAATTSVQVFRAWLRVLAVKPTGGTFTLGADREVLFVVPPS